MRPGERRRNIVLHWLNIGKGLPRVDMPYFATNGCSDHCRIDRRPHDQVREIAGYLRLREEYGWPWLSGEPSVSDIVHHADDLSWLGVRPITEDDAADRIFVK